MFRNPCVYPYCVRSTVGGAPMTGSTLLFLGDGGSKGVCSGTTRMLVWPKVIGVV